MRSRLRAIVAAVAGLAVVGMPHWSGYSADAAPCPTANPPVTVAGSPGGPGYTLTRGCIASFDGTAIVYDLYEPLDASADHPVYALLDGPGWGGGGGYSSDCPATTWAVGAEPPLALAADYAFLTWDPRGFGESGGVSTVNDPAAEARDVSALIDDVLTGRPEIALDDDTRSPTYGEPAVGMMGGSYGGGIQLAAAALDTRIKAIVPKWAWNDLDYSLFPGGTVKQTWFEFLIAEGIGVSALSHYTTAESCDHVAGPQPTPIYDSALYRAWAQVSATGYPDEQTLAWFHERSIAAYGSGPAARLPRVPTLLLQGETDTLFDLNEAWANRQMISSADPTVPVKLIGYCAGHAGCQYASAAPTGFAAKVRNDDFVNAQTIHWFDVYLRHDAGARDLLPDVLLQDQTGSWHALSNFPTIGSPRPASFTSTPVSGRLVSTGAPTDPNNPFTIEEYPTPASANDPGTLTVPVVTAPVNGPGLLVVGQPHVDLDITVTGSSTNLFFRLVDKARNVPCSPQPCWSGNNAVVDGQVAAIRVNNLDLAHTGADAHAPQTQHVSLDLVGVDYELPPGDTLQLQVSSATTPSAANRGASVTTVDGDVSIPVVPVVREDQPVLSLDGDLGTTVDRQATFTARLADEDGQPLAGQPVEFVLGESSLGMARTDESGTARISTAVSGPARRTTLSASFPGADHEFPAAASAAVTIDRADTTVALTATRAKAATRVTAILTEVDPDRPLAGQPVEFSLDGRRIGTAVTGAAGTASYDFGRAARPGQRVTAAFGGTDSYVPSSATIEAPAR